MRKDMLQTLVLQAVNMLLARDAELLSRDVSEWSIAHRLAVYLEELLPGWNIDCEYNRQGCGQAVKHLATGGGVRPDIAVHHRGRVELAHNLLVIEMKKDESGEADAQKVKQYTSQPDGQRPFQYQHGLWISSWRPQVKMEWFENGQSVPLHL